MLESILFYFSPFDKYTNYILLYIYLFSLGKIRINKKFVYSILFGLDLYLNINLFCNIIVIYEFILYIMFFNKIYNIVIFIYNKYKHILEN